MKIKNKDALVTLFVLLYVISPIDAMPGPFDDLMLLLIAYLSDNIHLKKLCQEIKRVLEL